MQQQPEKVKEIAESTQATQRVQMSRSELELYVRDGRPTGLLLRSVALLKGISVEGVAKSSGIPELLVKAIFDDQGLASVKKGAIKRVASVLGIDLSSMRLTAGQVHIFKLRNIPFSMGRSVATQALRAVGLLARGARVAELVTSYGLRGMLSGERAYAAQTENFRVVFFGSATRRFDLSNLPSATWVREAQADSRVRIENAELLANLRSADLTEGEFDELFEGSDAFTWSDVHVASRVNGVSKKDLMSYIATRAHELDATEDDLAKRSIIENQPFLRLVENDTRAAA